MSRIVENERVYGMRFPEPQAGCRMSVPDLWSQGFPVPGQLAKRPSFVTLASVPCDDHPRFSPLAMLRLGLEAGA
jgi:hypothetical protein